LFAQDGGAKEFACNATMAMPAGSQQRRGSPGRVVDTTLTPEAYLPLPDTMGNLPAPKEITDEARNGAVPHGQNRYRFSSSAPFVKLLPLSYTNTGQTPTYLLNCIV
jgi:hypothetical protein